MPKSKDFQKIYTRFVSQYGEEKGKERYYAWLNKNKYDDTKPFPGKSKKEFEKVCLVNGVEIKEFENEYHIEGLIATSHIDNAGKIYADDINDKVPKETLEHYALLMNTNFSSRVMGVHHSEGDPMAPQYFGVADVENNPAKVVELTDGEWGLYVDTKLLKNDPVTPGIIKEFEDGNLNSFSITYDTGKDGSIDFDVDREGNIIRVITPLSDLCGYTAASKPVNPNAIEMGHGFKEFKEIFKNNNPSEKKESSTLIEGAEFKKEVENMPEIKEEENAPAGVQDQPSQKGEQPSNGMSETEKKEFEEFKANKKDKEHKEFLEKAADSIAEKVLGKLEVKEKVMKDNNSPGTQKETSIELKEFREVFNSKTIELKEQFRRVAAICEKSNNPNLNWQNAKTSSVETREFKNFGVNGRFLEFKGLGLTTNQNSDTDYLQSSAELQDVYDPVIYNALNQETVFWNILSKDDYSRKGNDKVQFTLKIAANTTASFYLGNSVSTGNVGRLKYETKFKKLQVGVSVDGDMIAAARGGPLSDVFAQEVMDSTMDMLAVLNAALFAEVGLETASAIIGLEYITDSAGNTSLYNLTRSSTNKLSPDSASDTYINGSSQPISMANLRKAVRQAVTEGAKKRNLVWVTSPTQGDMLRNQFDDARRLLNPTDTTFGFTTDLKPNGIPVFEDKDCNTDDWFLVDLETHRVAIWIPPTIERLGKSADSEDAFIKSYLATYNRAPRRMVQIYGNATS
jgi:hypothetical protein